MFANKSFKWCGKVVVGIRYWSFSGFPVVCCQLKLQFWLVPVRSFNLSKKGRSMLPQKPCSPTVMQFSSNASNVSFYVSGVSVVKILFILLKGYRAGSCELSGRPHTLRIIMCSPSDFLEVRTTVASLQVSKMNRSTIAVVVESWGQLFACLYHLSLTQPIVRFSSPISSTGTHP